MTIQTKNNAEQNMSKNMSRRLDRKERLKDLMRRVLGKCYITYTEPKIINELLSIFDPEELTALMFCKYQNPYSLKNDKKNYMFYNAYKSRERKSFLNRARRIDKARQDLWKYKIKNSKR